MGLLWGCYRAAMGLLWGHYGAAVGPLWGCCGATMGLLWGSYGADSTTGLKLVQGRDPHSLTTPLITAFINDLKY